MGFETDEGLLEGLSDSTEGFTIEVDAELEATLAEMDRLQSQLSTNETKSLLVLCQEVVLDTIKGQFGLASLMLTNIDGGNVTTVHNFEQGVTASNEDHMKYMETNHYDRKNSDYDKAVITIKWMVNLLINNAKKTFSKMRLLKMVTLARC